MVVFKTPSQESEIFFQHNIFEYLIFACVFSLKKRNRGLKNKKRKEVSKVKEELPKTVALLKGARLLARI